MGRKKNKKKNVGERLVGDGRWKKGKDDKEEKKKTNLSVFANRPVYKNSRLFFRITPPSYVLVALVFSSR